MDLALTFVPCPFHQYGHGGQGKTTGQYCRTTRSHSPSSSHSRGRRHVSFRRVRTVSNCTANIDSTNHKQLGPSWSNHLTPTDKSDTTRQQQQHQQQHQEEQRQRPPQLHQHINFEISLADDDDDEVLEKFDNIRHRHLLSVPYQKDPSPSPPSPSSPPPGREDEFADSNGDSLQQPQGKGKVATLERDLSFDTVLQELSAIQQDGPRNIAILGTRHTSYLHQQIIELLTYANVLLGNHVFTSGAGGTNAAVIRGALRAERPDLLTVVLPQSLHKQPTETQEQLRKVQNLIEMKKNDPLPLDVASQLCNSDILSRCTHFIAFAFHDSDVV